MYELLEALSITALALTRMPQSRNVFEFVSKARRVTSERLSISELASLWNVYKGY